MQLLIIVGVLILLVISYFFIGMILKFLLGWFPLLIGLILGLIIGLATGWIGAIIGLIVIIASFSVTDKWQNSNTYEKYEKIINDKFYFND